ncbi:MAG: hypothetical protein AB7N90_15785, partial [Vicinamibacterales bacterium]
LNNPAHKRSKLDRLSTQGRKEFERMRRRERRIFAELDLPIGVRELRKASRVLRAVSDTLDSVES